MRYKKSVKGETEQTRKYHKLPWSSHMKFVDDTFKYCTPSSNISDMSIEIEEISSPIRPDILPQSLDKHESIITPSTI